MARRERPGLLLRETSPGVKVWHIDKQIERLRLRESTGCTEAEKAKAEAIYDTRVGETRDAIKHGIRPRRLFCQAAAKYLLDNAHKRGIDRDADALKDLILFIGDKPIDQIGNDTFAPYRDARKKKGKKGRPLSVSTINRNVSVAGNVLNLCARLWRHENGMTWLATAPLILLQKDTRKRKAYPLDWDEQKLFFSELAPHLERMALFDCNTGARDEEICNLRWEWERRVPELDTKDMQRSVFVLPGSVTKNAEERALVLNDVAQSLLEQVRGEHAVYVFTYVDARGKRNRLDRVLNSGWKKARKRAAARYREEIGRECPSGFRRIRFHDMRHTFGRRLRAVGVSLEDRQDLLGHKAGRVTTEYSAAEIGNLVKAANLIGNSRDAPQLTILKVSTS